MQNSMRLDKLRSFFDNGGSLRMLNDTPKESLDDLYAYASKLQENGSNREARNIFTLLVYCDHWNVDYLLGLAVVYQELDMHSEAIIYLAQAASASLSDPRALWLSGKSAMALKQWEVALQFFENAMLVINSEEKWEAIDIYCKRQIEVCNKKIITEKKDG